MPIPASIDENDRRVSCAMAYLTSQVRARTLVAVEALHLQRHAWPAAADTPHRGRNLLHAPDT